MRMGDREQEIFPKDPNKTYGLMELVKGTSTRVDKGPDEMVSSWPHLLIREAYLLAITVIVVLVVAILWNAPLEAMANPAHPTNPAKAPWYFAWLQELVSYNAFWGGIAAPGLFVAGLIVVPYLDRRRRGVGRWFARERLAANLIFTFVVLVIVTITLIGMYCRGPNWNFYLPWQNPNRGNIF